MGQQIRVLVVDDNADAADMTADFLRYFGVQVKVAYGGVEALCLAHELAPAVVFLDIGMPGIDGYEVAKRLREDVKLHGMKIVALTAWGDVEARQKSKAAGFDLHIVKPANMVDLLAIIN